ncbi:MAG: transcriptional repressor [Candidatus Nomurabacteria bacterium]|nr:MAG: transcriptional repressor [Candidatus Nomurabacteria bacterium]
MTHATQLRYYVRMSSDICEKLSQQGLRRTRVRHALHAVLEQAKQPLSVPELLQVFAKKDLPVNKTTIYRELEVYKKNDLVLELQFGEDQKRYELKQEHHHHFICTQCGKVIDVLPKVDLHKEEERLAKKHRIHIQQHSLEFFGLCAKCK